MPLVKPDPEPESQQPVQNIDTEVKEKAENFWSVLRAGVGKSVHGINAARKSKILKKGFNAVWYSEKNRKRKH